uniref:Metalloendopeptidase OMA1, mitochondrial n=1 Tax=Ciona savignyi TaxID=51511 RepID=H2Z656_CIOSA
MFRNVIVRTFCKTGLFKNQSRLARISTKTMLKMPQLLQPHRTKYIELALRRFSTSERRPVNPILMFLFKIKGIKVLKGVSMIFGRYSRMLHSKLPESIQKQLSKHRIAFSVAGVMLMYIGYYSVVHYDTCPITGRKRWITFTKEQILVLADMDRKALMEEYGSKILQPKDPLYQKCNSIVKSLTTHNADIDIVKDMEWKLTVIDDSEIQNAFVLPNGEIFLFTGMINVMSDWEELAIVIGHEMSHAILGHVQEQQSFAVFGELLIIPL